MNADQIKAIAKWLGYTQDEMAEAIGCTKSAMENYYQGKRKPNAYFETRIRELRRRKP